MTIVPFDNVWPTGLKRSQTEPIAAQPGFGAWNVNSVVTEWLVVHNQKNRPLCMISTDGMCTWDTEVQPGKVNRFMHSSSFCMSLCGPHSHLGGYTPWTFSLTPPSEVESWPSRWKSVSVHFLQSWTFCKDTDLQPLVASSLGNEFGMQETGCVTCRSSFSVYRVCQAQCFVLLQIYNSNIPHPEGSPFYCGKSVLVVRISVQLFISWS
jgi:hypothetical protein